MTSPDDASPIGTLDLNLLVTFDAIMVERNLRRAADRLGRSQPAVSHAVARLRDVTGDKLFEKISTGILPTPRAEALWEDIRDPLRVISQSIDHRGFDARTIRAELVLGLADDVHDIAFPAIVAKFRSQTPNLIMRAISTDHQTVWGQISEGTADLAVTVASPPPKALGALVLGEQGFVLLHRSDQTPPGSVESYLSAIHVAVGFSDRSRGYTDERLAGMGHDRAIVAITPRFASIPDLVRQTGAVATMPEPIARHHADRRGSGLSIARVPFELQPVPVRMAWHQRRRTDPLNEWARGIVSQSVTSLMVAKAARN